MPVENCKPMPFVVFRIQMDNGETVFYGGGCVGGRLVTNLREEILVQSIRLRAHGSAVVTGADGVDTEETYIDHEICLWGADNPQHREPLEATRHQFPFRLLLPPDCPPSLSASRCRIAYGLDAVVAVADLCEDNRRRMLLTVYHTSCRLELRRPDVKPLPRNVRGVDQPLVSITGSVTGDASETSRPKMKHLLRLAGRHYSAGEAVQVDVGAENPTDLESEPLSLRLTQLIAYHLPDGRSPPSDARILCQRELGPVQGRSYVIWKNAAIRVPSLAAPSDLGSCSLVSVAYFISLGRPESGGVCLPVRIHSTGPARLVASNDLSAGPAEPRRRLTASSGGRRQFLERKLDAVDSQQQQQRRSAGVDPGNESVA